MHRAYGLIALAAITLTAGCASTGSTTAAGAPSSEPSATASSTPAAAASPSSQICTTHACIATDLDKSLVGGVAQDEAVATKVTCRKSTVVLHKAAGSYSASCTVTYSDGSSAYGTGNLLVKQQKVTFQPAGT